MEGLHSRGEALFLLEGAFQIDAAGTCWMCHTRHTRVEDGCTYQKSGEIVYGKHNAEKEVKIVANGPQQRGAVCAPDIQDYEE